MSKILLENLSEGEYKFFIMIIFIGMLITFIIVAIGNIIDKCKLKYKKKNTTTKVFKPKSTNDILNTPIEEITGIIEDCKKDPENSESLLKIIKACYSVYNDKNNDYAARLKAAKLLDTICSHTGYYSTQLLYDFVEDIKNLK